MKAMKSCDFVFLAFLGILAALFIMIIFFTNQSGTLFFIDVLRFLIRRNVTRAHPVSLTDLTKATDNLHSQTHAISI